MKRFSHIRYNKSQRIGISVLIVFLVLLELSIWFINKNENTDSVTSIPQEITALQSQIDAQESTSGHNLGFKSIALQKFDPNKLDKNEWMNLGFSPKQATVILNYKKSLGGSFNSRQEIKECFVISDEKFEELAPYILLPEHSGERSGTNQYQSKSYNSKSKILYKKFNPNEYSQNDWMTIGFSEKQAITILKYKKSLGGKFSSLEQIEKCFVISEEKFREMKPFVILPKTEQAQELETSTNQQPKTNQLQKFNPNEFSREQWMDLGFSEKQVNTIFNYKKSLGGKFKDAETLKKCYSISEEKFAEIEPYLIFD